MSQPTCPWPMFSAFVLRQCSCQDRIKPTVRQIFPQKSQLFCASCRYYPSQELSLLSIDFTYVYKVHFTVNPKSNLSKMTVTWRGKCLYILRRKREYVSDQLFFNLSEFDIFTEVQVDKVDNQIINVVGEKFRDFSYFPGVITCSELINEWSNNNETFSRQFVFGQGVTEADLNSVKAIVRNSNSRCIEIEEKITDRADRCLVHKHKPKNVLITTPEKINENEFKSSLIIDEDCELLDDHIAGLHVQGLVFVEAARQMHMAVTEMYDLTEYYRGRICYALDKIEVQYHTFLFPMCVNIKLTIIEKKWDETNETMLTHARTEFTQLDQCGCEVMTIGTGITVEKFKKLESLRADRFMKRLSRYYKEKLGETRGLCLSQ